MRKTSKNENKFLTFEKFYYKYFKINGKSPIKRDIDKILLNKINESNIQIQ